ncbi:MAG TPA: hypothetical protein VHM91_03960, partial [Verrucomicrobiales bacterium]|nr:hypothetical protein [Verrucomicrobiales bacterium]
FESGAFNRSATLPSLILNDLQAVQFYGYRRNNPSPEMNPEQRSVWSPTEVQFFYRHANGRYYVRTYAGGNEKWASLKTTVLPRCCLRALEFPALIAGGTAATVFYIAAQDS